MTKFDLIFHEQDARNRYSISALPTRGSTAFTPDTYHEKSLFSQKAFLDSVKKIIKSELLLFDVKVPGATIYTLSSYITKNDLVLEIAKDEFYGVMVESEDKETMDFLLARLKEDAEI